MKRKLFIFALLVMLVAMLAVSVNAASESDLTFKINGDGNSYYVSDCNSSAQRFFLHKRPSWKPMKCDNAHNQKMKDCVLKCSELGMTLKKITLFFVVYSLVDESDDNYNRIE